MFTSIAIIGRPNVGKSSLFNKLTRSRDAIVSDFPGLTKDRNYGYFESEHKKTLLIDTGGISQSNDGLKGAISRQAWIAVQESSLIILLIDGSEDLSKEDLEIITNLRKLNKEFITVVNKIDKSKKRNRQIKVENTLAFLTKTSEIIRQNSLSKIIAITGSCGKTSLKELLRKTLSRFGNVSSSPKSFNNKYGVPLSLFNLNVNHDYGVFEAGMDKKGEIDRLTKIIKPDVGIITNISYAHAKNFKNINQIALAKAEIINNIKPGGLIILNADDSFFSLHKKIALKKNLQVLTFGMYKKANVQFRSISRNKN